MRQKASEEHLGPVYLSVCMGERGTMLMVILEKAYASLNTQLSLIIYISSTRLIYEKVP
jgi:hypothetical protein